MRAVVQTGYGNPADVLEIRDVPAPIAGDGEVLVQVRAASVHPDVWHVVTGLPRVLRLMGSGMRRPTPTIPGTDVAGVVEAVGPGVTRFRPGDEVFGETILGMQWRNGGAYASQVAVAEDALARKPEHVTFEQAACVPTAGLIALANLPDLGSWPPGQQVLVNGAGGGVGAMAIQLARTAEAEVTAVDHLRKHELLRELGADRVVDYTTDDFTRSDQRYDLAFDVVGNHRYAAVRRVLAPDGTYVLIGHDHFGAHGRGWLGSIPRMMALMGRSLIDERLPRPRAARPRAESMSLLHDLLEDGSLTPIVDRSFPLDEVPEAIALLASGRALGRIVVVP